MRASIDELDPAEQGGVYSQTLPVLLLRPKQAAQVLAISERLLWDLTDAGEIPVVYIGKKQGGKRYRLSDLEQWVAQQPTGKVGPNGA